MKQNSCYFCNKIFDINKIFLDFNDQNNSINNVMYACETCREVFYQKVMMNSVKTCTNLGLKITKNGEWIHDNKTVRQELVSSQTLQQENINLRNNNVILQEKLSNLINIGYENPKILKYNQRYLTWDLKKNFHCWQCGREIRWFKRNGRYLATCRCGKIYKTEIDRLIVSVIE